MAVSMRKLAPEEVQRVFPRRGQQNLSEYMVALRELYPGDTAGIGREELSNGAIKRRLGVAAKQLGYRLKWSHYSRPEGLYFQVIGAPPGRVTTGR